MPNAAVTSQGPSTVRKAIRDALGLQTGDEPPFTWLASGCVLMRACNKPARRLLAVAGDRRPVIALDDLRTDG